MRTLSGLRADSAGPQRLAVTLGSLQRWRRSGDVQQPVVGLGHPADEGSPRLFSRGKSALDGHGHLLGRQVFISDSQSTQSF